MAVGNQLVSALPPPFGLVCEVECPKLKIRWNLIINKEKHII